MYFTIEKMDHIGNVKFKKHWSVCFWQDGCMVSRRPATREEVILWEETQRKRIEVCEIEDILGE
jgi:hypothetical protein